MSPKNSFKIPLQSEVASYMKERKNWPMPFCVYYAERFWNFYQSNGWKVSGRALMKDWKAAFNSQWQSLKFPEDLSMLAKCINGAKPEPQKNGTTLNDALTFYYKYWDKITDDWYVPIYNLMKEKRLIVLTEDEKALAKKLGEKNGVAAGKAYCVKAIFDKMRLYGRSF